MVDVCGSCLQQDPQIKNGNPLSCLCLSLFLHLSTPSLIKICRPWLLIKSHLKSLKVSLRLIQFAFLNREHCLKGLINWTGKKMPSFCTMPSELVGQHPKRTILPATRPPTRQMSILTYAPVLFHACAFQGASKKWED